MSRWKVIFFSKQTMSGFGMEFNSKAAALTAASSWEKIDSNNYSAIIDDPFPTMEIVQAELKKAEKAHTRKKKS